MRSIIFGTRNARMLLRCNTYWINPHLFLILVALNFSVLLIWIPISCVTMPLIQWYVRRKDVIAERMQALEVSSDDAGKQGRRYMHMLLYTIPGRS
jgi:hypothetical protein